MEEYNADVHMKFRQMGSRLINMTRKGTVISSVAHVQVFGNLVTQTKTRNAAQTFQDATHTELRTKLAKQQAEASRIGLIRTGRMKRVEF